MIDITLQDILWVGAGILLLAFLAVRLQRALYDLLLDREGAAKHLIRRG